MHLQNRSWLFTPEKIKGSSQAFLLSGSQYLRPTCNLDHHWNLWEISKSVKNTTEIQLRREILECIVELQKVFLLQTRRPILCTRIHDRVRSDFKRNDGLGYFDFKPRMHCRITKGFFFYKIQIYCDVPGSPCLSKKRIKCTYSSFLFKTLYR